MSDPRTKAERARAKDKRQGIDSDGPARIPAKRKPSKKTWAVFGPSAFGNGEWRWHKAATKDQCEEWLAKWLRTFTVFPKDQYSVRKFR